jgi:hypothetical protein
MALIDQTLTWRKAEERLATEPDPVLRRNLELLIKHMKGEAAGDLDAVMSTVSERAHYHTYNGLGEQNDPRGKDGVRKFYEDFIASGAGKLHHDLERLVIDRDCIFMDGIMRMAYPGRTLQARGIAVDDPDSDYLFETRMAIVWPMDEDGLFVGEDAYMEKDGFAGIADRKIDPADIIRYEPAGASDVAPDQVPSHA